VRAEAAKESKKSTAGMMLIRKIMMNPRNPTGSQDATRHVGILRPQVMVVMCRQVRAAVQQVGARKMTKTIKTREKRSIRNLRRSEKVMGLICEEDSVNDVS
jgi:hypothetical protein